MMQRSSLLICRERNPCPKARLSLNVAPLRHVQTVQELSDILVADLADLLDVGGTLGNVLEGLLRVSREAQKKSLMCAYVAPEL
jgi:hypothetical protein